MPEALPYNSGAQLFFGILAYELIRRKETREPLEVVMPAAGTWVEEDIKALANALAIRNCSPDTLPKWFSAKDSLYDLGSETSVVVDLRSQECAGLQGLGLNDGSLPQDLVLLTNCGNPISTFRKIDVSPRQTSLLEVLISSFRILAEKLDQMFDPTSAATVFRSAGFRDTMAHFRVFSESDSHSLLAPKTLDHFCQDMSKFWTYQERQVEHQTLLNWIRQFDSDDAKIGACNLLEFMHRQSFLSRYDIERALSQEIEKLRKLHRRAPLVSIQNSGKSEGMLHYEIRSEKGKIRQISDALAESGNTTLVIVDDVIGSGKTVLDCMFEGKGTVEKGVLQNWLKCPQNSIYVVVAVASGDGIQTIECDPRCFGSVFVKSADAAGNGKNVFSENAEIFESDQVRTSFENECKRLGASLFAKHPLGWQGCAWAVATSYNVPNCSLPVIWASKTEIGWQALLDRR